MSLLTLDVLNLIMCCHNQDGLAYWFHNIEEEDISTVIDLFRLRYEQLKPKAQIKSNMTVIPKNN